MTADLTLDGLAEPVAHTLRPWISELARGEQASSGVLRRVAEGVPDQVRAMVALTRSIDVALGEAVAPSVRLSELLDQSHSPIALRRPIRAAHTRVGWLLKLLRASQPIA